MENRLIFYLRIAGILNILLAVFHAFFPLLFNWKQALSLLDPDNRGIYQTLNIVGVLIIGFMAYVNLKHAYDLLMLKLARPVLLLSGLFYLVRIAAEFLFFVPDPLMSGVIVGLCGFLASIYLFVLKFNLKQPVHQLY